MKSIHFTSIQIYNNAHLTIEQIEQPLIAMANRVKAILYFHINGVFITIANLLLTVSKHHVHSVLDEIHNWCLRKGIRKPEIVFVLWIAE
ncbi:hypothetical protein [Arcticibacter svalbardensis]|uniref:hypothetical protein n=1 Tax=Arcticibacter svalbardensis TaxID=1288027 RepID=UPI00058C190C|nr:hypothetical protein [Arcticibacter svalbardensis]